MACSAGRLSLRNDQPNGRTKPALAREPYAVKALVYRRYGGPDMLELVDVPRPEPREREILVLIANHHSNPEIAEQLSISLKTVRNHVSNIFSKLQVVDRAQAILKAHAAGLGDDGSFSV